MANSPRKAGTKGAAGGSRKGKAAAAGPAVTEEERQRMIAEAAYLRAAQREFNGGDPAADWADAEAEINKRLLPKGKQQHLPSPKQQKAELAAYERLREEAKKRFAEIKDTVNADAIRDSIDAVRARAAEVLSAHYLVGYPGREMTTARNLRLTPLHARLAARGAFFGERSGWERASWFAPGCSSA